MYGALASIAAGPFDTNGSLLFRGKLMILSMKNKQPAALFIRGGGGGGVKETCEWASATKEYEIELSI